MTVDTAHGDDTTCQFASPTHSANWQVKSVDEISDFLQVTLNTSICEFFLLDIPFFYFWKNRKPNP